MKIRPDRDNSQSFHYTASNDKQKLSLSCDSIVATILVNCLLFLHSNYFLLYHYLCAIPFVKGIRRKAEDYQVYEGVNLPDDRQ